MYKNYYAAINDLFISFSNSMLICLFFPAVWSITIQANVQNSDHYYCGGDNFGIGGKLLYSSI